MNLKNSFSDFTTNFFATIVRFWKQLGSTIAGQTNERFGYSISMNASGDRVVVGAPYSGVSSLLNSGKVSVYSWNGSIWSKLGSDIQGAFASIFSGWSVSMNAVGDRIAIGIYRGSAAGLTRCGVVKVYSWNGNAWTQLGADINGEAAEDFSGWSVSINAAGDRVVIGAPNNDGNGLDSGHARVYSWNGTSWTQLGVDINGKGAEVGSGTSVSINNAGDRIITGAPYMDTANTNKNGYARIHSWNGSSWTQLGSDINGDAASDYFGYSVSMNSAGDRVVIGAQNVVGSGGYASIYSWNGTTWSRLGSKINLTGSTYNISVSINAAGDRVAIGCPSYDGVNGLDSGIVRIYSWDGTSWTQLATNIDGLYYNSTGWSASLNDAGDKVAVGSTNDENISNAGSFRAYELKSN